MPHLSDKEKAGLFRELTTTPYYEAGLKFGLDKHYNSANSIKAAVKKVYNEVSQDPERFFVHPDTVELVEKAIKSRIVAPHKAKQTLSEKNEEAMTIENVITKNRDLAASTIQKKLERLNRNKKALDSVGLSQLATAFGILFDKSQLIQGQATEHVAHMGKIDTNMKSDEAIDMVIKMREKEVSKKNS